METELYAAGRYQANNALMDYKTGITDPCTGVAKANGGGAVEVQ